MRILRLSAQTKNIPRRMEMAIRLGINGFGRIGRTVLRYAVKEKGIDIVAINDLTDAKTLAHLLKYDSVHGIFPGKVEYNANELIIDGKAIKILAIKNPEELPWKKEKVDIVLESTGLFTARAKAELHLKAGAKKGISSAPATDEDITVVMGVNHTLYDAKKHNIISNASCTTNCLAPVAKVLQDSFGIEKGLVTTIHSYTNDQNILDLPHKDLRRARAAAMSMIPTTNGSVVDLVATLKKNTDADKVNAALQKASKGALKGILGYCDEPLVSIDFNGNPLSSIVDAGCTKVLDGNMVKVLSWYDNESGFSKRVIDLINYISK